MLPSDPKQRALVVAQMYGGTVYEKNGYHGVRLPNGGTLIPSLLSLSEIQDFAERQHRQKKRYSQWQQAALSVSGTIYGLGDSIIFGALPDTVAGVRIVPENSAGSNPGGGYNIPQAAGQGASDTAANTTSRLPDIGSDIGAAVGAALRESLDGAGDGTRSLLLPVAVVGAVGVGLLVAAGFARGRR